MIKKPTKQLETTLLEGWEEREATYVKKTGRFLVFFKTEWFEKVSDRHIGNDIQILTDREIRQVYLNGKPLIDEK